MINEDKILRQNQLMITSIKTIIIY